MSKPRNLPYGYKIDGIGRKIKDKAEQKIIEEIVSNKNLGDSFAAIAEDLTRRRVTPPRGGAKWAKSTVAKINKENRERIEDKWEQWLEEVQEERREQRGLPPPKMIPVKDYLEPFSDSELALYESWCHEADARAKRTGKAEDKDEAECLRAVAEEASLEQFLKRHDPKSYEEHVKMRQAVLKGMRQRPYRFATRMELVLSYKPERCVSPVSKGLAKSKFKEIRAWVRDIGKADKTLVKRQISKALTGLEGLMAQEQEVILSLEQRETELREQYESWKHAIERTGDWDHEKGRLVDRVRELEQNDEALREVIGRLWRRLKQEYRLGDAALDEEVCVDDASGG